MGFRNQMKRVVKRNRSIALGVALLFSCLVFAGCGCLGSSGPRQVDVIGENLGDAYNELHKEDWSIESWNETPYSDYIPGSIENGDERFSDSMVTRVEYQEPQSIDETGLLDTVITAIRIISGVAVVGLAAFSPVPVQWIIRTRRNLAKLGLKFGDVPGNSFLERYRLVKAINHRFAELDIRAQEEGYESDDDKCLQESMNPWHAWDKRYESKRANDN